MATVGGIDDRLKRLEEKVEAFIEASMKVAESNATKPANEVKLPISADLNNDGVVSPIEKLIYDSSETAMKLMAKHHLVTQIILVGVFLVSFLFSILAVKI